MIKEALWDGMDGWDWMVIIGHRYSKSTFNANKETFLDALASLESMLESEWVMLLRFCQIWGISSGHLQGMFRVCSGYVQSMFRVCSG